MKICSWIIVFCGVFLFHDLGYAKKKIQRSCEAYYQIERLSTAGSPLVSSVVGVPQVMVRLGFFKSRRGCGKSVPNTCRERARDSAQQCMQYHWSVAADYDGFACSEIEDYSIRYGYLRGAVEDWVCSTFAVRNMAVRVKAVTRGDTGCARTTTLDENFLIQCGGR